MDIIRCRMCDLVLRGLGNFVKSQKIEKIRRDVIVCPRCGLVHDEEGEVIQHSGEDVYVREQ